MCAMLRRGKRRKDSKEGVRRAVRRRTPFNTERSEIVKKKEAPKKVVEKQKIESPKLETKEAFSMKEVIILEKEGWKVAEIKSGQVGIREKTWVMVK